MSSGAAVPITIRQVAKAYGRSVALDGIDLDVRSGEFMTLLGPSGSGKTTLLMVLAGFVRPDQGSLRFGSDEVVMALLEAGADVSARNPGGQDAAAAARWAGRERLAELLDQRAAAARKPRLL